MNFKHNWVFLLLIVFMAVGIYTLTCYVMPSDLRRIHENPLHILFDLCFFTLGSVIIFKGNALVNRKVSRYFRWDEAPFKRLAIQVVLNTIITTTIIFVLYVLVHIINGIPPNAYFYEYKKVFIVVIILFFFFQSAYLGLYFFSQWKKSLVEAEKLKFESLHSQLHALQNQANPHFLFNSLNVLASLIESNPKTAVSFVQRLADVYRYVLQKTDQHLVELKEELNFINSYVFLQQNRFGNHLQAEIEVPADVHDFYLPPYTLQILFENAIKHNIVSSEKPLTIKLYIDKNNDLVVENNLQPKLSPIHSIGLGLKNIKERYEILSEGKINVIKDEKTFKVVVPLIRNRSIYESINN